jgi:hypothetical protein
LCTPEEEADGNALESGMEPNGIDASLGLALAIDLLKEHQQTGELRGNITIVQFLSAKHYRCIIRIEQGRVVSCALFDKQGQQRPINTRDLLQIDEKGGPFDWKFYPREEDPSISTSNATDHSKMLPVPAHTGVPIMMDDSVPVRLTSELHYSWLTTWNANEIRLLQQIFMLANGQRTIREIKALMFRYSPVMIEKSLVFLIAIKQIEIRRMGNT